MLDLYIYIVVNYSIKIRSYKFKNNKNKLKQMSKEELIGEIKLMELDKIFNDYQTNKQIKKLKNKLKRFNEVDVAIIIAEGTDW